jgi:hypothetical protein
MAINIDQSWLFTCVGNEEVIHTYLKVNHAGPAFQLRTL